MNMLYVVKNVIISITQIISDGYKITAYLENK